MTIFAAASLTNAFNDIGEEFERRNEGVDVEINFVGSPALVAQVTQGADADLLALANPDQMRIAQDAGLIGGEPLTFTRNELVIAVPASNPAGIRDPEDLAGSGTKLVIAAEGVPAGEYGRAILAMMSDDPAYGTDFSDRVLRNVVSEENNVRQVLTKVQLGEADAGIVYETDASTAADDVDVIGFPDEHSVSAAYTIAPVRSGESDLAEEFIDLLVSDEGRETLRRHGFQPTGGPNG
ncbi:MAG: molybdate ABC transporter substrate-binding protein [Chloroflexota bacterium]